MAVNSRENEPSYGGWGADDVEICALGTKFDVNYCAAARLASRLKGAARHVGPRILKGDLQPPLAAAAVHDDDGGAGEEAAAGGPGRSINNALTALGQTFKP